MLEWNIFLWISSRQRGHTRWNTQSNFVLYLHRQLVNKFSTNWSRLLHLQNFLGALEYSDDITLLTSYSHCNEKVALNYVTSLLKNISVLVMQRKLNAPIIQHSVTFILIVKEIILCHHFTWRVILSNTLRVGHASVIFYVQTWVVMRTLNVDVYIQLILSSSSCPWVLSPIGVDCMMYNSPSLLSVCRLPL
jgi:hypothetical protein